MPPIPDTRVSQPPASGDQPVLRSRRSLLRSGVIGGGAAALLTAGAAGTLGPADAARASASGPATPASASPQIQGLFTLSDLDFDTLFAFGGAGYGAAEFGELVAAVNAINSAGASYQGYYDTFLALAQRTAAQAGRDLAAGHAASARSGYLRAASYYDLCLYFILATSQRAGEAGAYAAMQRCWHAASQLFDPPFEPVRIPCEGSWLPGYLLKPDSRPVRRPTIILNNGEDAQNIRLWAYGGAAALERGYNALIFEGPGQGSMLFERQVPFRYDWESAITPIVDYLRSRPDVDPGRIVLNGSSLGGELVIRAAAFEHRLAAVVADPGFLSVWESWTDKEPKITGLFSAGYSKDQINATWQQDFIPAITADPGSQFDIMKAVEGYGRQYLLAARAGQVFTDLYDLGTTLMKFTVADVASQVTAPTLVTSYENDDLVVPSDNQGPVVYSLLTCPKARHQFTAAEGADQHCAPMAPQTRNQAVYDWLDTVLA
ncbi:MAG TPA: acetylxylan esterase [Trebonia sp.]|nr:acetylxylan esterase [Trebonia sp.]